MQRPVRLFVIDAILNRGCRVSRNPELAEGEGSRGRFLAAEICLAVCAKEIAPQKNASRDPSLRSG
jgi:hypothetical protein